MKNRRSFQSTRFPAITLVLASILMLTLSSGVRAKEPQTGKPYHKVLFLGNSITLHGPAPKIGWEGNWGMAASAPDKDYVHLVTAGLTRASGAKPETMVKNIASFERAYATFDINEKLKEVFDFKPDLVILAIGENVPQLKTEDERNAFEASVDRLLKELKKDNEPTIIVRSSFWPNAAKDVALKNACQTAGGIFIDLTKLGKDETNYARSERDFQHAGVAAHPGDKGMQAIAVAILKAIPKQEAPKK